MKQREQHPNQWARIEQKGNSWEIVAGPGPRPHKVDGDFGHTLTDEQLVERGYKPLVVVYDDQFDPDVQQMLQPVMRVESGDDGGKHPVMYIQYEYQPSARPTMLRKINEHYNRIAEQQEDATPLLMSEYQEVQDEVRRALRDPNPVPENYPMLAASIGVTRRGPPIGSRENGKVVADLVDAIDTVSEKAQQLRDRLTEWRKQRLTARFDIREAATDDAAFAAYRSVVQAPAENAPWHHQRKKF